MRSTTCFARRCSWFGPNVHANWGQQPVRSLEVGGVEAAVVDLLENAQAEVELFG